MRSALAGSTVGKWGPRPRPTCNDLDADDPAGRGRPERLGADGRLYTTLNDSYPQVRRYRVEIEER